MAGTGEIKYSGRTKTSTAAVQFDTGVSSARGRKPSSKITWSSRLRVDAAGQPLNIAKKNLLKSQLEPRWTNTNNNTYLLHGAESFLSS
jgi:hypothetical protein